MAFLLISLFALGVLLSSTSIEHLLAQRAQGAAVVAPGALDGLQFVRFSVAMERYIAANPSVSGNIPVTDASGEYTGAFLSQVNAWVSAPGTLPRVLICSGHLGAGALAAALRESNGDAALGTPTATGQQWVSATAPMGGVAQTLPMPVSAADTIVFVVNVQS